MSDTTNLVSPERFDAVVLSIEALAPSVRRLRLALPAGASMNYQEGQYLCISLPDGGERSYSMASAASEDGVLELHVRLHESGRFSRLLSEQLVEGDRLQISGPFGTCVWQESSMHKSTTVMLATGTGIAPLVALLQAVLPACKDDVWLYWGGKTRSDLYLFDYLSDLSARIPNFRFVPVLTRTDIGAKVESGFVQDVASRDHPDMSDVQVYACGSPVMIRLALDRLTTNNGLSPDQFFADAFESFSPNLSLVQPKSVGVPVCVRVGRSAPQIVRLESGGSVMASLRDAGLVVPVCGGNASCGTCRVTVSEESLGNLPPPGRTERRLLVALKQAGPFDRLSCQITVDESLAGVEISIPGNTW